MTAPICNLQPTSRGAVNIIDRNPATAPSINPNYLMTERDRDIAVKSIELTREIARQSATQSIKPKEIKPGPTIASKEELVKSVSDIASSIFHPVSTCKMGNDKDKLAVVDPNLQVKGFDNLYIADASVFPKITSGNTHAPTVMVAEYLAESLGS